MKTVRQLVALAALTLRPVRLSPGEKEVLLALARSYRQRPIHPILVRRSDMAVVDGNRRVQGMLLDGVENVEVELVDDDLSDVDADEIALESAFHRAPLGGYEQAVLLRRMKESTGLTQKALAEKLHIDAATVTKLLSVFELPDAIQESAKAGNIGVTDWYAIFRSKDRDAAHTKKLNGATRDDLERDRRRGQSGKEEGSGDHSKRRAKINVPIFVATKEVTAKGTVTVAGLPGEEIGLVEAEDLLSETLKAVRDAQRKGTDAKTFEGVMRGLAAKNAAAAKAQAEVEAEPQEVETG